MCILCESKQKTYLSTNQKNDYHTHALYSLLGPQGSRSVCLGTFSLAAFRWTGWENNPQNPQQSVRAVEMDELKGFNILQGLGPAGFTAGKFLLGETSSDLMEGCAVCVSTSAGPALGGVSLLSLQSLASSHSVGNEKWHLHKVESKSIVSITHYALHCSGDISYPIRIICMTYCAQPKSYNVSLKEMSQYCQNHSVFPTPC